ncbi:MAG: YceH family protein [Candidatus Acidiferrales bacterium]
MAGDIRLTEVEARVLGALVEKEITTPEYYPLSLNALVNACNQKSNREPVMNLDEDAVTLALQGLSEKELAGAANTSDSRVRKYEHHLQEYFNFTRPETAALCVLLLRGAQTPGEIRGRAERLHPFEELSDAQAALQKLMQREPPLAKVLARQPGTKESRYMHLLSGEGNAPANVEARATDAAGASETAGTAHEFASAAHAGRAGATDGGRIGRLEDEVAALRDEVAELKQQLAQFRKQFE